MWVVTGCLPFEFKEKTWWFPVVGNVSYKGFFDEAGALMEADRISQEGYETDIYNPEAWSTLGYFTDPVLSNMLKRGPGKLAELIIHELAHATVFLPDEVDLNENLATMAGELGALRFLASKYGKMSNEYIRYTNRLHDDEIYYQHMLNGFIRLDSLYKSFDKNAKHDVKANKKYKLIATILLDINKLPLKDKNRYRFDFEKNKLPGNTEFMSYSRYRNDQSNLKKTLATKYRNDIGMMLKRVQQEGVAALD
jgi:predicted aminopeptidase